VCLSLRPVPPIQIQHTTLQQLDLVPASTAPKVQMMKRKETFETTTMPGTCSSTLKFPRTRQWQSYFVW
jgi:hypothetical protein